MTWRFTRVVLLVAGVGAMVNAARPIVEVLT
jgi:hypothetical protein